ncbi:MAG: hypothetical protein ABR981_02420 [Candidatus Micrarchaeaceae archaeon]|jgi:hypothetical protein
MTNRNVALKPRISSFAYGNELIELTKYEKLDQPSIAGKKFTTRGLSFIISVSMEGRNIFGHEDNVVMLGVKFIQPPREGITSRGGRYIEIYAETGVLSDKLHRRCFDGEDAFDDFISRKRCQFLISDYSNENALPMQKDKLIEKVLDSIMELRPERSFALLAEVYNGLYTNKRASMIYRDEYNQTPMERFDGDEAIMKALAVMQHFSRDSFAQPLR